MAQAVGHFPDPGIVVGPYRILPRTDGRWIAYDDRLPLGARAAAIQDSKELAIKEAKRLVSLGSPMVSVSEPPPRNVRRSR